MLKMKKFASFLLFFTILGTVAASAQISQPQPQQQQKVEVSDGELEKFANAFQGIRMITQQAQQEMMTVVQKSGMNVEKFNKIQQASMNPETTVEATSEEKAKHKEIAAELEDMQMGYQEQMQEVIEEQDLTLQRYEQIAMGLQNDPELQERLKAIFQG
ncbi:DUF4168 domain-containing protein [Salinimicrobium sp. GXAS 041]|uniref:DUF4168 domain-containing protein n=1 Tax=Salinimicrobium sp. GXAS 041 TaxID=3400806 RepID=UPI003C730DBC